jgi:hypothetical protein
MKNNYRSLQIIALIGLSMESSVQAATVIANLGNSAIQSEINTQGFSGGIDASNYSTFIAATGDATTFTFVYDLSGLGLGSANTLEIAVTANGNLTGGGGFGLAVKGGSNNSWYDVGETLSFDMTIKDSVGADITAAMDTFSFSGFSARGLDRDLNGQGDLVTISLADQNLNMGGGTTYYEKTGFAIDLSGIGNPYHLNSSRSGQDDVMQLGQLQFEIIPEPGTSALLGGLLALGCVMLRRRRD